MKKPQTALIVPHLRLLIKAARLQIQALDKRSRTYQSERDTLEHAIEIMEEQIAYQGTMFAIY
tara:strand:- start:540 stop:728 length:189 start_codon:yes stop_codon:yes gene_type:complete